MAWITMISKTGNKIKVTESIYNNMYKESGFYSLESKPISLKEEKKEEVGNVSKLNDYENKPISKGTKKTISK